MSDQGQQDIVQIVVPHRPQVPGAVPAGMIEGALRMVWSDAEVVFEDSSILEDRGSVEVDGRSDSRPAKVADEIVDSCRRHWDGVMSDIEEAK